MINIMIAEDYDILREDTAEKIRSFPDMCVTALASSGKEAVMQYKKHKVDIVLMDIEMDDMEDGIRAAEEIINYDSSARIIYLTSHDADRIVILAMATGARDYIVKGCSAEELRAHIEAVWENRSIMDSRISNILMGEYRRLAKSEQGLLYFIREIGTLTPAEKELVSYLLEGLKIKKIAERRCVESVTVKSQIRTLLQKFGVSRTHEIVKMLKALELEHLFK